MQGQQLRLSDRLTVYQTLLSLASAEEGLTINLSPFVQNIKKGDIISAGKQCFGILMGLATKGVNVLFVTAGGIFTVSFSFISLTYSMQSYFPHRALPIRF